MENAEVILTIQRTKNDIAEALKKEGMDSSEDNISKIIVYQNLKQLEEQLIERGWEIIESLERENKKQARLMNGLINIFECMCRGYLNL